MHFHAGKESKAVGKIKLKDQSLTMIRSTERKTELKQKKSVEDYLKIIYIISKTKEVHGTDIAAELKVSRPTVSVALKALAEEGYIFVDDAYEVHLTVKGRQVAEDTYERHNTFQQLLISLGVDEKTAAADACEMEHVVSQASYEALKVLAEKAKGESAG